jgi:hypothetical protein
MVRSHFNQMIEVKSGSLQIGPQKSKGVSELANHSIDNERQLARAPGLRPQYTPDFCAAYVRDPDGDKLAAVCRGFGSGGDRKSPR